MGEGMKPSAAVYVRNSVLDDPEGDNRNLGTQERKYRTWAERKGLIVRTVNREAVAHRLLA